MRHAEEACSTPPARFAARHGVGPGFGFSLTRIHRCSCGLELRGTEAMEEHLRQANWLCDCMNDPRLPLIRLDGEEEAR